MKPMTIRAVLGEFFQSLQKIATADDATLVEKWNNLPKALRQFMVNKAQDSLIELNDINRQKMEARVAEVQRVLAEVTAAVPAPVGQPIPIAEGEYAGDTAEALEAFPQTDEASA